MEVSCPLLAFRLPLFPESSPHSRTPELGPALSLTTPFLQCHFHFLAFRWDTCYREAIAQLKARDRLHMAPNDMLLIASCAPPTLPRTHGPFLVPNPHHRLTALLTWGCHQRCGSWGGQGCA